MVKNWFFYQGTLEDGYARQADEALFRPVTVPHTWNAIDGQDGCKGGKNINETDYDRGDGWYRTWITLDVADADLRHFVRFQGVNMQCDVYVNEKLVGSHKGGYTAFCFDISSYLHFGNDNLLAVRVNNAQVQEIAPLQADFTFYGGIYREVTLIKKEKLSFQITERGVRGLTATIPSVTKEEAICHLEAVVENAQNSAQTVTVQARIGELADEKELELAAGERKKVKFLFHVPKPHLWNGRKDPYLYKAELTLLQGDRVWDRTADEIGFRFFHVDREKGFFLNGEPYALRGVSRHQDRQGLGNAITQAEHDEDFKILEDIGATAVRLAHYPQAEYFYRLCDRAGILVWAEIPFVDLIGGTGSYSAPDADRAAFFACTKEQLTELILQNKNHPAIFCWGLQNEVKAKYNDVMIPFMEELDALAKSLDPYRLTTQATNQKTAYAWKSDLICWNVYPGWYGMHRSALGCFMDKMRTDRPLGLSEYGAGGNHLQQQCRPRKPKHNGQWHPEQYQTMCHEAFLRQIDKRDYLWCTFVWNLFDFGSDGRNEGSRPGMNDKGLVSFDRKVKKDSYYVYQSRWSQKPMLQIAERRFINRPSRRLDCKIYSNLDQVAVFLNGKKIGEKTQEQNKQFGIYLWKHRRLKKGKNLLRAEGRKGDIVLSQEVTFCYDPSFEKKQTLPPPAE